MISALYRLLLKTAWAPVAVLVLHAEVARTPVRDSLDFTIHFLGGAAIAFVNFHALDGFQRLVGCVTTFGRYLFAFALACTVGVFWEFAELFSDTFLHTHIQQTIQETMSDLIADTTGAVLSLFLVYLSRRFLRTTQPTRLYSSCDRSQ